jgi:general secretion pathway protein L
MREIELPIADLRKVREVLPMELKGETAVDSEELVFDALPLHEGKFLAIWGKQEKIAENIRIMTNQGVEPEIVTAALFYWHTLLPDTERTGPVALTDGESVAVYDNGTPVYFRSLGRGEMVAEVTRTLAALEIAKGINVGKVFLHGNAARQALSGDLEATPAGIVFTTLPITGKLAETFSTDSAAALDLAGSYALASVCGREELVNFRKGGLAYTAGLAKIRKKLRLTLYLAAAVVFLLFSEVGLRYYLVTRDLNSLNKSVSSIYRDVFPSRKKSVDEVAELRSEIKRLSGSAMGRSILPTLKKLAELKGDSIAGFYETEIEGGKVRVKGDANSVQAVNDFRTRAAAAFTGAEVGEVKSRSDGSVSFVLTATVKEGEK